MAIEAASAYSRGGISPARVLPEAPLCLTLVGFCNTTAASAFINASLTWKKFAGNEGSSSVTSPLKRRMSSGKRQRSCPPDKLAGFGGFDPPSGVQETAVVNKINVAPNPLTDNSLLSFESVKSGQLDLQITDYAGRRVAVQILNYSSGKNNFSLPVAELSRGIYFLTQIGRAHV